MMYNIAGNKLTDTSLACLAPMLLDKPLLYELWMEGKPLEAVSIVITPHTGNKFSKAALEKHMAPVLASLDALETYQYLHTIS